MRLEEHLVQAGWQRQRETEGACELLLQRIDIINRCVSFDIDGDDAIGSDTRSDCRQG